MTQINEHERYDRQERIWGKDGQRKLADAKVTVAGTGAFAKYTALPLVALGVGEVRLLGARRADQGEMLLDDPLDGSVVLGWEKVLSKVNPTVRVIGIPDGLESRLSQIFLEDSDVIVEASNSPRKKSLVFDYVSGTDTPVITGAVSNSRGNLRAWNRGRDPTLEDLMPQFEGAVQDELIALLWGGIAAEEVKKIVLGEDERLRQDLYFHRSSEALFSFQGMDSPVDRASFEDKSALVVGAGALGNILAIALARRGYGRVDYLDYDRVESTNLNRQVLFYDAVGALKAETLARKHVLMNPLSYSQPFVAKLDIKGGDITVPQIRSVKYDVIFDALDNLYARAIVSAFAVREGIPMISVGTEFDGAQNVSYVPGITSCLDHVIAQYYEKARSEEMRRRISCLDDPNPSVIITNQIAGALAALQADTLFDRGSRVLPHNGIIKYGSQAVNRLGVIRVADVCRCTGEGVLEYLEIRDGNG